MTTEEFVSRIERMGVQDVLLGDYKGRETPVSFVCHKNNKHAFSIRPMSLFKRTNFDNLCPYCSRRKVFVGETDIWSEDPEMASMLMHHDDGYRYMSTSSAKADWVCPRCHTPILDKVIANVKRYGLSCPVCSDGVSFGEKFVGCMLKQLGLSFLHNKAMPWSKNKRYDFIISDYSMIIEVNGVQHYSRGFVFKNSIKCRSLSEEKANDVEKANLAKENGINLYIIIDVSQSSMDYIRDSIYKSRLIDIFDLSLIDWDACAKEAYTSYVISTCDLWNNGFNTLQIADMLCRDRTSVIKDLKNGSSIGLCVYEPYIGSKNQTKKVRQIETGVVYKSLNSTKKDGFQPWAVRLCCKNKEKTSGGFHWEFVE